MKFRMLNSPILYLSKDGYKKLGKKSVEDCQTFFINNLNKEIKPLSIYKNISVKKIPTKIQLSISNEVYVITFEGKKEPMFINNLIGNMKFFIINEDGYIIYKYITDIEEDDSILIYNEEDNDYDILGVERIDIMNIDFKNKETQENIKNSYSYDLSNYIIDIPDNEIVVINGVFCKC